MIKKKSSKTVVGRLKILISVSQCFPLAPPSSMIDTFSLFILVGNGRLDSKVTVDYYHYYLFIIIIFGWAGSLLLLLLFLAAVSGGYSLLRGAGFPLQGLLWFSSTGSRHRASVVGVHGVSCSLACGIFPNQGLNCVSSVPPGRPLQLFIFKTLSD